MLLTIVHGLLFHTVAVVVIELLIIIGNVFGIPKVILTNAESCIPL